METELAKKLVELLDHSGEDGRVYEAYSGRGMFGETTTGVVCDGLSVLLRIVLENANEFVHEGYSMFEQIGEFRTDNLGYDTIIY